MCTIFKAIGAAAGAIVTLALGWIGVVWLWPAREAVGGIAIALIGIAVVGAAVRVAQSTWRGEKLKFWWLE